MEAVYPYAHIIHLLLAIVFLGYIFFDVVIFPVVKKTLGEDKAKEMKQAISSRTIKIMPLSVLLLVLTGGMMMTHYVNSKLGWFTTPMQQLFMIKVLFAAIIALGIIFSLSYKAVRKQPNPITAKYLHPLALILGIGIVILAKTMFIV